MDLGTPLGKIKLIDQYANGELQWCLEEYKKQSGDPSGDLNKVNEFFNWTKENLEELYFKFMEKGREKGNR